MECKVRLVNIILSTARFQINIDSLNIRADQSSEAMMVQHDTLIFYTNIAVSRGELCTPSAHFTLSCSVQKQTRHRVRQPLMEQKTSGQKEKEKRKKLFSWHS